MKTTSLAAIGGMLALMLAASGCGQKGEGAAGGTASRKGDTAAAAGAQAAYHAPGWKPGDAASWEQHLRTRMQSQNEYVRAGASAR